ncbi:MAG: type III-B CRISPR module-associated protein Cmr5 [Infirmifilum sp.]
MSLVEAKRTPVAQALEVFIKIHRIIADSGRKKAGSKLRARAREMPGLIVELGLPTALSFCLAKAGVKNLMEVVDVLEGRKKAEVLSEIKGEEELGYALYAYVILWYLYRNNYGSIGGASLRLETPLADNKEKAEKEFTQNLLDYLNAFSGSPARFEAEELLLSFLLEFKRLCEAVFESEERTNE